jgi:phosphatidylserine decarboxylase
VKFAREGYPLIFASGVVTLALNLLAGWWAGLLALALTIFIASFFRDPDREIPEGEGLVVSPADGRVTAIDADRSPEALPGEHFQRVSIFMSPLNVHVNRIPEDGDVVSVKHTPGRFGAAYQDRASIENERNEVVLRDAKGRTMVFVQIAGALARRIICRSVPGDRVKRGDRFGLIMFGSKVDVYLPASARVLVRVGERVRAGSHILGELA